MEQLVTRVWSLLEDISLGPHVLHITALCHRALEAVDSSCADARPWQLLLASCVCTLVLVRAYRIVHQPESLHSRVKKAFFRVVRRLPYLSTTIQGRVDDALHEMSKSLVSLPPGSSYLTRLPEQGLPAEAVISALRPYKEMGNADWKQGFVSGTVYHGEDKLTELLVKAYGEFAWSNPLHPDVFPGVRKMEAEIVAMSLDLFHGGPEACGTVTSGGTESILMACKAYRDMALARGVTQPEIVAPESCHAAFNKAAHYFGMTLRHVPLDPRTMQVDIRAMRRAIGRNTAMLVGSAPQFPHGIIDPIEKISALGVAAGVPVHVDACLGGFLIVFMDAAGFPLLPFDFRLPGVTSISADTHKYGYAPKGSSVVLYSSPVIRHFQYFVAPDWMGGIYASPSIAGSRPGAIMAATWAAMVHHGRSGYVEATRKIVTTARLLGERLRTVPGLYVFGEPLVSVVAVGSRDFDIFRLSDALMVRGWHLNTLQFPSSIHIAVTLLHTRPGVAEKLLDDITSCVAEIMLTPTAKTTGKGAIYGMAQSIPDRSLITEITHGFLDCMFSTRLPETTQRLHNSPGTQ
ncbi:sphingosine-1-phosphate lyase 1 [Lampetra planeri]